MSRYTEYRYRSHKKAVVERIRRECLRCGREFWAKGRFNRSCDRCHERGDYDEGYRKGEYVAPGSFYI